MTTNIMEQPKQPSRAFRLLMKAINPFMKRLLRSPLHWIVSKQYMLITVKGRKSGRLYTTPVQYKRIDDTLYIITSLGYTWWKNLRSRAAVDVLIGGEEHTGIALAETDLQVVESHINTIYPSMDAAALVERTVAVTVELGDKAYVN